MLVLSRQVDETVMIGDTITVTVVSIESEMATLFVRYRDANQRVEQKLALEIDDRLEITEEIYVSVVEIREDKIRIAIVAPKSFAVHRKEVYEAIKRENRSTVQVGHDPLILAINNTLHIGQDVHFSVVDSDGRTAHVAVNGRTVGGASDGEGFIRSDAISVGSVLEFGTLLRICVVSLSPAEVGLKIENPTHMMCRIEK